MKKKTIIILFLIILVVFLIYIKTRDNTVYYVNLTDEHIEYYGSKYSNYIAEELERKDKLEKFIEFQYDDDRITDLIHSIRENDYIYVDEKKQAIQNALIKADLLTIHMGKNDIDYGLMKNNKEDIYNYLDTLFIDFETLLEEIRKYTKEQIMLIGFYTLDHQKQEYIEYFNQKVAKLCEEKEINFISVNNKNLENISLKLKDDILAKFTFS